MKQLCLCCSNATNKVCYSAGFPKQARDCLPDWVRNYPALLSECHHGKPQGLPSCHSNSIDKVMIVQCIDLNAYPKKHIITGEFKFTPTCLQLCKCNNFFFLLLYCNTHSKIFARLILISFFHMKPTDRNNPWHAHNERDFYVLMPGQNQTARSHGGLSSRSNNHIGSTLLLRLCPAHSVWPVGLKKISCHCRPDLTLQPQ